MLENTHRKNKTDGYSRALRDLDRAQKAYHAGIAELGDETLEEVKNWLKSQLEISEARANAGKKGGAALNKNEANENFASSKTQANGNFASSKSEAKSNFAVSNKGINNRVNELDTDPPTPLDGGHVSEKRKHQFEPRHMEMAQLLDQNLKARDKAGYKAPKSLDAWANEFRLMETADRLTPEAIWKVLHWLPTSQPSGDFPGWGAVTESPAGLRRKWSKIWPQVSRSVATKNGAYLEEARNDDAFMEEVLRKNQEALDSMNAPAENDFNETGGF